MAIAERVDSSVSAVQSSPATPRKEFAGPVRVASNTRPLLFHGGLLFCARFDRIVATPDLGKTFFPVCRLATPWKYRLTRFSPLAQRASRCQVYRMRLLPDGTGVYVFRRGVYAQARNNGLAQLTFLPPGIPSFPWDPAVGWIWTSG